MRLSEQVLCIVFRSSPKGWEVLLLRRIPAKGGFWQPVSGGVESTDKDREAAALRELAEEAGIGEEHIIRLLPEVYSFSYDRHYLTGEPITPVHEFTFGIEVTQHTTPSLENNPSIEHDDHQWVSFDEAIRLVKWENNKDALRALKALLEQQSLSSHNNY